MKDSPGAGGGAECCYYTLATNLYSQWRAALPAPAGDVLIIALINPTVRPEFFLAESGSNYWLLKYDLHIPASPAPAPATLGPGTKNSPYQSLQSGARLVSAGHCPCGHNTQIIDTTPHQTAHGICPAQDWMIETEINTETFSQFRNYDFTNNLNTLPHRRIWGGGAEGALAPPWKN